MCLKTPLFYAAGSTRACRYAADALANAGYRITDHPSPDVTHLLLDVPSFDSKGNLRGGQDPELLLSMLPDQICVIGGKLNHPALSSYETIDLLAQERYLVANAAITAHCALKVAAPYLQTILADTPTLIVGWGRIGKCLADLLYGLHCPVTVTARKEQDRCILRSLGYSAVTPAEIPQILGSTQLLFNTVPQPVIPKESLAAAEHCIQIELASQPGLSGPNVIPALGLPGVYAPESSGKLIAEVLISHFQEVAP